MSDAWLIVETSERVGRIGLVRDGAIARTASLDDSRRHVRDLALTVGEILRAEGIAPRDLTGAIVGRGPGSYTGLRVGLMSAKALAYATGCKLVAVDTFAAIAAQAPTAAGRLWVLADALQNQVYLQPFARSAGAWQATEPLRIVKVEDAFREPPAGTWMSGPGVKVYRERIPADCPCVAETDREPTVDSVYAVGRGLPPLTRAELFALEPLYLRGSSAEERVKRD